MSKPLSTRLVTSLLVLVWLFVVTIVYYVYHRPFSPDTILAVPRSLEHIFGATFLASLMAVANVLADMGTVLTVVLFGAVLGHRLCRRFEFASALEEVVLETGIGLGALGLMAFGFATLGIVNQWIYWIVLLVSFVLLRKDLIALGATLRSLSLPLSTRRDKALAYFCALTLVVTFLFAFTPPWSWDGLQYHLIAPKLILEQGRVAPPPDNFSLNFPSLVEMLFSVGMVLRGDGAVQGLHWIFLPLTLGAMLAFAQRYFTWRVGWLAAALLCAIPSMVLLSTWAYNDLALMFYTFSAFVATLVARASNQRRDSLLSGVLCGLALGEKYTAGLLPILLAVVLFRPNTTVLRNILVLLVSAGVIAAPWFIRNSIFTGNPFYPYVFGGPYWDSFRTAWNTRIGTGMWQEPLNLLLVPWTMTVQGMQSGLFDATIGPLLLVLLPLNLLRTGDEVRPVPAPRRTIWLFVLALYLVWLVGVAQSNILWQTRFFFPAFPLLAVLAAQGLENLGALSLPRFSVQRFTGMTIAIVLAATAVSYTLAILGDRTFGYFLGAVSRTEYLTGTLQDHFRTAQWVNDNVAGSARILFLWEPRTYYFAPRADGDVILDAFPHLHYQYQDAATIAAALRHRGYTHVLLYREGLDSILQGGMDPVTPEDVHVLSDFVTNELVPLYGPPSLDLVERDGKLGLANASQAPYAVYEIKAQ